MKISVSHERRSAGNAFVVVIICKCYVWSAVECVVRLLCINRVSEKHAIFVQAEFAVGNSDKVSVIIICVALEIKEFVPVIELCGGSVYLVMTDKFNMVYPEIITV